MVGPEAARAEDVWHRAYPLWEAYFAMVLVGTVALTCVDDVPRGRRAAAVGLLVLLGLVYAGGDGRGCGRTGAGRATGCSRRR